MDLDEDGNAGEPENLDRDTLVELRCKCGERDKKEQYRFLGIFCNYYNKWFVSLQGMIGWGKNKPTE